MTFWGSTVPRMCGGTLGTPRRHDRFSLDGSWNRIQGGMDGVATVNQCRGTKKGGCVAGLA